MVDFGALVYTGALFLALLTIMDYPAPCSLLDFILKSFVGLLLNQELEVFPQPNRCAPSKAVTPPDSAISPIARYFLILFLLF